MFPPESFIQLAIACFGAAMTQPTTHNLMLLLPGWLMAPRRTVTAMIQAAGLADRFHHARFHRLFAAAHWSLDKAAMFLFERILTFLPQDQTIFLVADDTLAHKRGLKVYGVGMHHDPQLSSRAKTVTTWGHSWVVLGVVISLPFRPEARFCLPILFRLYRSHQTVEREGSDDYKTRPELLVQMLELLCQTHGNHRRHFHLLVDGGYSGGSVAQKLPANCDLTGRCHKEAMLFAPPPKRRKGQNGRPRKMGKRLPTPHQMVEGRKGKREELALYGKRAKVRVAAATGLWYKVLPTRQVRVVAVSPLQPGRLEEAFFSTCLEATAVQVLTWYAWRWAIEVTFHEAKGYLGFEEPQGWSRLAVERTAPMALLLYSLVVLWFAREGHEQVAFPYRPWYPQKREVSFADMLRTLRRRGLEHRFSRPLAEGRIDKTLLHELISLASNLA